MKGLYRLLACVAPALCVVGRGLAAQGVTTGSLAGIVTADGVPAPTTTVVATHVESGTRYIAETRGDGHYVIRGMRVGGPYTVTVRKIGLAQQARDSIYVTLGQSDQVDFELRPAAVQLSRIIVTGTTPGALSGDRTGAATTVSREALETMPTISGRLDGIIRLTPQSSGGYSFAGQDSRFNNITVDGSYFNNSFGLGSVPGDRTGVAPISLDAIEQVQVNVAPFDVRQGNFVGANVNTVTRSGTNRFRGSIRYQGRDQSMVGTKAGGSHFDPGTSKYQNFGGWLAGPILQNKLFYFVDYETDGLNSPATTFTANTGAQTVAGTVTRVKASDLDQLASFLQSKFNYTAGAYQGYNGETPAKRMLGKLDYNLNERNKVSLRYTRLDSKTDVLLSNSSSLGFGSRRSNTTALNFENSNYQILENIRSIVGELNSSIGSSVSNTLTAGFTHQDESRGSRGGSITGPWFPFVDILSGNSVYTSFGMEPFTPNNELRYDTWQALDNLSVVRDNHTFTFGTSLEKYHSENVFYPGAQSVYVYSSLADFYTDANDYFAHPNRTTSPVTLRRFQVRYMNIPGMIKPIQPLDVIYTGAYAQDDWTPIRDLKLSFGLRADVAKFGNTAYDNPTADALTFRDENGNAVHYNSGKLPDATPLLSPRLGFNWDVRGDRTTQVRGGTGVFTGKPAYVWISNQIGNTGILTGFDQFDNTTARPFNPSPDAYKPTTVTGASAASYELDVTDTHFKFPQLWRTDAAIDKNLPWGLTGTAEMIYDRDVNGIYYINANLPAAQSAFVGPDSRPRWTSNRINPSVTTAIVLKNENSGYAYTASASLERAFAGGLFAKAAYSKGIAKNSIDAGSIASGSWTANPISGNPNLAGASYSGNALGDRVFLALTLRKNPFKVGASTFSLFSEYRTAGNASYTYSGDMNGDGAIGNDLIYIPKDKSEMNFQQYTVGTGAAAVTFTPAQQADAWDNFIQQDDYLRGHRGQYAERGGVFMPMVFRSDFSFSQALSRDIAGRQNGFELRIDILNVGNLLDHNWGIGQTFVTTSPLVISGSAVDANGRAIYQLRSINNKLIDHTYQPTVGLSDVYRFQLSLRYNFQ
jgi:Carboxypeptidase regulatory-like domain